MTRSHGIFSRTGAVALLTLALSGPAFAMTAAEYFEDGNRLLEDDLYFAALLRYRQAGDAGYSSPLLQFNVGVANYRAGQYVRARESFMLALDDPELGPLAQYNLGLNAYATGDTEESLRWLRLARDQAEDDTIARYAEVAIGRVLSGDTREAPEVEKTLRVEESRGFTKLALNAKISFGNDSNPFRAPSAPYIDYSDPNQPVIVPVEQAGAFMPVALGAKYQLNAYDNEGFFAAYRLDGRYYQDKELENANEYLHEVSFGSEYRHRDDETGRERRLYSAFRIGQRDQVYYDRDNGGRQVANDVDVSDRFRYVRYGPELALRQFYGRFGFGIRGRAELWNYDPVEEVPEYDHEFFLLSTYAQVEFTPTSLLRVKATGYTRRFGDRRARSLDGSLDIDNDTLTYNYLEGTVTARQRVGGKFWFGVDYEYRQREDKFVGYADYTRNSYGAEVRWGLGSRLDFEVSGHYRLYNFTNAYAFHDPARGAKTLESRDTNVRATYRMTPSLFLVFEATIDEQVSTDSRLEYDRSQFVLGVHWEP
jgi:tetratricopeptide (TPR) repeat protein